MCGIVGIYSLNGKTIPNLKIRLNKMMKLMNYRGPDNEGIFTNQKSNFGMGNNQLSIVSPSKKIKLPLTYNNQTYLSFNGEIYNYKHLKEKFKLPNKYFKYLTDTEVLYHLLNIGSHEIHYKTCTH